MLGLMAGSGLAQAHVTYNLDGNAPGPFPADGEVANWSDGAPAYSGNLAVNWAAYIHNDGGVSNSQTADSAGAGFPIATGARSYKDGLTNWGVNSDYGLINL